MLHGVTSGETNSNFICRLFELQKIKTRLVDEPIGSEANTATAKNKKHTVLLIEDNEDFLFYLKDNLNEYYNIVEAIDGKEGWQKTLSSHPDIVVSDISMPGMDGI
jgi:PleD family two-component response regulator